MNRELRRANKRLNKPIPNKHSFKDDLKAIEMSFPVAMYIRDVADGEDPLKRTYCHIASHAGARVIRSLGYEAKVIACSVVWWNNDEGVAGSIGHSLKTLYEWSKANYKGTELSFEEFAALNSSVPPEESPHMIIEARSKNTRALLDLSLGQISHGYKNAPKTMLWLGEGWPFLETDNGTIICYDACQFESIDPKWFSANLTTGIEEDVLDIMTLAKKSKLDRDLFVKMVSNHLSLVGN